MIGPGEPPPPGSSLDVVRGFARVYQQFAQSVAADPTVDTVLEVAETIAGLPVVLTDDTGTVLRRSRTADAATDLTPPPVADLLDGPVRLGSSLCATALTVPGSAYTWFLDGAEHEDLETILAITLAAEYCSMLDRYAVSPIPETWRQRSRLVRLMVESGSTERIRALAHEIGHDISRIHHVVVVESSLMTDAPRFALMIGSRIQDHGLIAPIDGRVVIVVGDSRHLHPLVEVLRDTTDVGPFHVGVSAAHEDGFDLSRALDQAIAACEDRSVESGVVVRWYDESDPISLMVRFADEETIRRYIDNSIGPLLSYDGPHREEFLETLRVRIDSTDSLDAVAQQLHIHRSTLVYRIRRIKEVLGHDLRDPDDRFGISAAFRMLDRVSVADDPDSLPNP